MSQQTNGFDTDGRASSFSSVRVQKNHNLALCSPSLALGQYKRAKEMSYECLDTRKCCHAT
jgi:hypothetical protein